MDDQKGFADLDLSEEPSQSAPHHDAHKARRLRWASVRHPNGRPKRYSTRLKRLSLHRGHSTAHANGLARQLTQIAANEGENKGDDAGVAAKDLPHRRVYVNRPLPPAELDEEGIPLAQFPRNKTRSAKYTPLSFVPKNLFLQFHNIANVYFLFIVILSIFSIFGASNPGLGAVPIIVIVTITAIKDAIEDYRRTVLDLELNNSPTQILSHWTNPNVSDDDVSAWRRFKKASTRVSLNILHVLKRSFRSRKSRAKYDAQRRAREDAMRDDDDNFSDADMSRASADLRRTVVGESFQMHEISRPSGDYAAPANPFADSSENDPYRSPSIDLAHGSVFDPSLVAPGTARFKRSFWKAVRVGDIIRIRNDDEIPADVIVLSTSDADGACYVETKNLDGETNLKVRQAVRCGHGIKRSKDCEKISFLIESEAPHPNLYSYSGVLRWSQLTNKHDPNSPRQEMAEPLTINNMLLRGCTLRNTDWVIGVVMFTGVETKIMLNSGETPSKRSRLTRELNWNVLFNFLLLFVICFVSGVIEGVRWSKDSNTIEWFEFGSIGGSAAVDGLVTFWTCIILFQSLVPISLYISIEIIKTIQAFFIYSDTYMYYEPIDYPCTPKSWNISDDLGQIEYVFSDKTGTLTQNVMELKKVTVNGVAYGEAYTEAMAGIQKRQGMDVEVEGAKAMRRIALAREEMLKEMKSINENVYLNPDNLTFVSPQYIHDLKGESGDEQADAVDYFMMALALCHSVLAERVSEDPPVIEFKAQSPDEAALVATARDVGYAFIDRTQRGVVLNVQGEVKEYPILTTLEFNSTRKRMSAIVRMPDTNQIVLFCKGADSVIYSRLRAGGQEELKEATAEDLEIFANEGLRTLCIAHRILTEEEYKLWSAEYDEAAAALTDREEKMEIAADRIERNLILLGGTAIEDRLQDGVPDAISLLAEAGVKLWVLTGDKVETAINIGFSCNILGTDMNLMVFQISADGGLEEADQKLREFSEKEFGLKGTLEELEFAKGDHAPPPPTHALVIDGEALKLVLDESLKMRFLLLCKRCKAVMCCRVSPAQKAAVVKMVKVGLDVMTLAIGDGANDVAMIQAADVGVGIAGEEGRQAVMSSDYAIGQFRFLSRLLLVHGRWSYRRLAEMIANFFYKNVIFTFALFWYQIYNDFDGSYLFDYTYIMLYNLAFTSLPVILMGILDQDVNDKVSLAVPQLYQRGILRLEWTQKKFWRYMFDGMYQSVLCFYLAYFLYHTGGFQTSNGLGINQRESMGVFVATACIIVANLYVFSNQYRWDWIFCLIVLISILLIFAWTGIYTCFTYSAAFFGAANQVYGSLIFWATVLLSSVACLLPHIIAKSAQKMYYPLDIDLVREQISLGHFDYLNDIDPDKVATLAAHGATKEKKANGKKVEDSDLEDVYIGASTGSSGSTGSDSMAKEAIIGDGTNGKQP
ncbi:aminophospholipid-translocating P4-type ATPase [Myxozyma melibiosi]|uniref:Phospholipid-transporting ATPase n=1 Tax=Myxozyma melibiosi TaxID=54550 RepID=A0ABR1F686_9ASCO